jgi:hypothetical protein
VVAAAGSAVAAAVTNSSGCRPPDICIICSEMMRYTMLILHEAAAEIPLMHDAWKHLMIAVFFVWRFDVLLKR